VTNRALLTFSDVRLEGTISIPLGIIANLGIRD
jgi:hypothetical protein